MNYFAHCGFSNVVGPQLELTLELNKQFLPVKNYNELENIDENVPFFDDNKLVKISLKK